MIVLSLLNSSLFFFCPKNLYSLPLHFFFLIFVWLLSSPSALQKGYQKYDCCRNWDGSIHSCATALAHVLIISYLDYCYSLLTNVLPLSLFLLLIYQLHSHPTSCCHPVFQSCSSLVTESTLLIWEVQRSLPVPLLLVFCVISYSLPLALFPLTTLMYGQSLKVPVCSRLITFAQVVSWSLTRWSPGKLLLILQDLV